MFWETPWPLVLRFGLSGAVQAFVSKEQMERVMGDHRAKAVARASGFGMMSSSCSYAAGIGSSLIRPDSQVREAHRDPSTSSAATGALPTSLASRSAT